MIQISDVTYWQKNIECKLKYRVKSGNFGHQANSDICLQTVKILMRRLIRNSGNPDETAPYEPSHQDFHCLLQYFFIPIILIGNKQGRCPNLPDVRRYLTLPYLFVDGKPT